MLVSKGFLALLCLLEGFLMEETDLKRNVAGIYIRVSTEDQVRERI